MNILIIIRCWLRETFAHADFNNETLIVRLKLFLFIVSTFIFINICTNYYE